MREKCDDVSHNSVPTLPSRRKVLVGGAGLAAVRRSVQPFVRPEADGAV
jgi:hypothetical protein